MHILGHTVMLSNIFINLINTKMFIGYALLFNKKQKNQKKTIIHWLCAAFLLNKLLNKINSILNCRDILGVRNSRLARK